MMTTDNFSTPQPLRVVHADQSLRNDLIDLLSELNSRADSQCLHCDTERSGLALEVDKLLAHGSIPLVAAFSGDRLIGALGCELNDAETNCWFRGPFLRDASHSEAMPAMYHALTSTLPGTILDLMAFPNADNTLARSFYTERGFDDTHTIHIYTAPRPDSIPAADTEVQEYTEEMFGGLETLHDIAFTTAVERAPDVVADLNAERKVFVLMDEAMLAGYIAVSISDAPVEGFVDFLAVHPDKRGKGIGERLLKHAMHWFFAEHNMPQAGLCVRNDRTNARRLYERAGFTLFASGVGMRYSIKR